MVLSLTFSCHSQAEKLSFFALESLIV